MDQCSSKRGASGPVTPRKPYTVAFKGAASKRDQNAQFCNRIGCSGRIKHTRNTNIGSSDKAKCSKPSLHPSNGNEMNGKPSRSSSLMTRGKRSYLDTTKKFSQLKFDPSESSPSTESEDTYSPSSLTGTSTVSSDVTPREVFPNKSQHSSPASSVPLASRGSAALRPLNRSNGNRCGLRNLKCNSISDVVPPRCSSLESIGKNMVKKRSSEGESSSSSRRGRMTATASLSIDTTSGISISNSTRCSSASRMRLAQRQNGRNSSSVREPALGISQFPDNGSSSGSRSLSSTIGDDSYARTPFASAEPGFFSHLMNHERYNMDGIAEVLLALERIEQDEELTHEQVLALETSLFLSGLNLYDQHRDMRLDIDNMSYEELLALEERMGTVSTALSEEALSKCLRRSIYQAAPSKAHIPRSGEDGDDIKCSICQEEYVIGNEIGTLVECQHGYHIACINQWLRLKNWCPICKASAAPSQSSSSL